MEVQKNIIYLESVDSTNNYARNLLNQGKVPEGTVIWAGYQTVGRGQLHNKWESEPNSNLLVSIILHPSEIRPEEQFILSMAVSLAIKDLLDKYITGVKIKWPNDIYSGNDKIAGILIENAIAGNEILYTIAGIGLNVNQENFLSNAPNPVSLKILTREEYKTDELLNRLVVCLNDRYGTAKAVGRNGLDKDYHSSLWRLGEWHKFRSDNEVFSGQICGTDKQGCLLVRDENGVIANYAFKKIEYL